MVREELFCPVRGVLDREPPAFFFRSVSVSSSVVVALLVSIGVRRATRIAQYRPGRGLGQRLPADLFGRRHTLGSSRSVRAT